MSISSITPLSHLISTILVPLGVLSKPKRCVPFMAISVRLPKRSCASNATFAESRLEFIATILSVELSYTNNCSGGNSGTSDDTVIPVGSISRSEISSTSMSMIWLPFDAFIKTIFWLFGSETKITPVLLNASAWGDVTKSEISYWMILPPLGFAITIFSFPGFQFPIIILVKLRSNAPAMRFSG